MPPARVHLPCIRALLVARHRLDRSPLPPEETIDLDEDLVDLRIVVDELTARVDFAEWS